MLSEKSLFVFGKWARFMAYHERSWRFKIRFFLFNSSLNTTFIHFLSKFTFWWFDSILLFLLVFVHLFWFWYMCKYICRWRYHHQKYTIRYKWLLSQVWSLTKSRDVIGLYWITSWMLLFGYPGSLLEYIEKAWLAGAFLFIFVLSTSTVIFYSCRQKHWL